MVLNESWKKGMKCPWCGAEFKITTKRLRKHKKEFSSKSGIVHVSMSCPKCHKRLKGIKVYRRELEEREVYI